MSAEAILIVIDDEVNRLPVLDGDRLVGVVSRQDLLGVFRRPDEKIEAEIDGKLKDPLWAPEDIHVSVSVHDGVVEARGSVRVRADRQVVNGLLGSVPGVVAVDSDLSVREPDVRLGPYLTPPLR